MSRRDFFIQLSVLSVFTALLILAGNHWDKVEAYSVFAWSSLIFFILLSLLMYFAGRQAALSENKHRFTNAIIIFTMLKMALSVLIILGYFKLAAPPTKWFILPFFTIYLIFTIFEASFLTKLGKINASQ
jgi:hypothetical protein